MLFAGRTKPYYGWYVVLVGFLVSSVGGFASIFVLTVVQVPMSRALGIPLSLFLSGLALRTLVGVAVSPIAGMIADRRRGPSLMLLAGGTIGSATVALTAFATELWQLYLLLCVTTIALGGATQILAMVLVARWFRRGRGLAMSLASMGPSGGSILLIPLASLVADIGGWQWTWILTGALVAAVLLPSALFVARSNPRATPGGPDEVTPSNGLRAAREAVDTRHWTGRQAMRTPALWLLTAANALVNVTTVGFIFTMPALIDQLAPSGAFKALALTAFPLGTFVSRPIWGLAAARLPSKTIYYISLLTLAASYAAVPLANDPVILVVLGVAVGFTQGANIPLYNLMLAEFFGTQSLGSVLGFAAPVSSLSQAAAPVLPALVAEWTGSYAPYLFACAFIAAAITILIRAVRPPVLEAATPSLR